jgi:hypothetical protein
MRTTTRAGAFLALLFLAARSFAADPVYAIRDGGFAVHNGGAYFNRPLAGTPEPSMLLSGDQPEFVYLAPTGAGKIGNLRIGIVTEAGGKWLDEASSVDFLYQPGWTRHTISDPLFQGGVLEAGAVPLSAAEGFSIRMRWVTAPRSPVKLVWLFGGASGAGMDARVPPLAKLHLSAEDAAGNTVRTWGAEFDLTAPSLKGRHLYGRCDLPGTMAARDIGFALKTPTEAGTAPAGQPSVAVFTGDWPRERASVHITVVLNRADWLAKLSADPARSFEEALAHYRGIARRAWVKTPDAHFDLAFESMVMANDAIWQPPAYVHGAASWMIPYLGWRIWYGPDALGWHERVRSAIQAFAALQIKWGDARGGIPDTLTSRGVYYNMNEVYLDHIHHHYAWTGDRAFLASLYPMILGVLAWEKQHLDPDSNGLYEGCLNTWISDSHWYNGGDSTQATAYMYRAQQLAAEAAEAAGADPTPHRGEAARIHAALNKTLWLSDRGHYAEYIDRIGLRRLHPEPELPTIYHPIEFALADPFQAYQMLRFTETTLRNERDLPFGGRLVWSSRWAPNHNHSYVHSTHELAFAEQMNLALAYYKAGQAAPAYEVVKGSYAPMYMGAVPGGMPCHAYTNGAQRHNEEFADGISMFARVAVEGVFGIVPEMQRGTIHITPGFPSDWKEAEIQTPDVGYSFRAAEGRVALDVTTEREAAIHFRVPLDHAATAEARINGAKAEAKLTAGIGTTWCDVTAGKAKRIRLEIVWTRRPAELTYPEVVARGEKLVPVAKGARILEVKDPQGVLAADGQTVQTTNGPHSLFIRYGDRTASQWRAVNVEVRPAIEITGAGADSNGHCRYRLRNNTPRELRAHASVVWGDASGPQEIVLPAGGEQTYTARNPRKLLAGTHELAIDGLPGAGRISKEVPVWREGPLDARWRPISIEKHFNDSFATVLLRKFWTSEIPYAVCRDYSIEHLNTFGIRSRIPDDSRLRAAVDAEGMLQTPYGIPFAQKKTGPNMVALSRWPELPSRLEIPLHAAGRRLYVLLSALTFPMQSHIANARIRVKYNDGGTRELDLENPRNFDNGWGLFGGTYHYTSHGVFWLGDNQFFAAKPFSPSLLEQHEPWKAVWQDFTKIETRPHADIVDVELEAGRAIRGVEIEVLSQDVILAVLGVTLAE